MFKFRVWSCISDSNYTPWLYLYPLAKIWTIQVLFFYSLTTKYKDIPINKMLYRKLKFKKGKCHKKCLYFIAKNPEQMSWYQCLTTQSLQWQKKPTMALTQKNPWLVLVFLQHEQLFFVFLKKPSYVPNYNLFYYCFEYCRMCINKMNQININLNTFLITTFCRYFKKEMQKLVMF